MSSAALQKTPITILNELCMQEGDVLIHEDIPHETNNKMFACKVEAFGIVEIGSARSKKQAKHDACENLIGELTTFIIFIISCEHQTEPTGILSILARLVKLNRFTDRLSSRSPTHSKVPPSTTIINNDDSVSDAVEILRNICLQRKWPYPEYV